MSSKQHVTGLPYICPTPQTSVSSCCCYICRGTAQAKQRVPSCSTYMLPLATFTQYSSAHHQQNRWQLWPTQTASGFMEKKFVYNKVQHSLSPFEVVWSRKSSSQTGSMQATFTRWAAQLVASAFNPLDQYASSHVHQACCYSEFAVSSLVMAKTITSTHCISPAWIARMVCWYEDGHPSQY